MIRLGLIGAGKWGKNYITAAKESGLARVEVQASWEWRIALGSGLLINGVIVATPPGPRPDICRELAKKGYPMMVEKPLCLTMKDVEQLRNDGGALKLVDYVHLFSPAYERLRKLVCDRPGRLRIYGRSSGPTQRDYSLLWDHACHDLAMCLGFGVDPAHPATAHQVNDTTQELDITFSDDVHGHFRVGLRPEKVKQLSVLCGSWSAVYDGIAGTLDVNGMRVVTDTEYPLTRAVRAFAQAVKDGGTDDWRFGIDSSVTITKVLEEAQANMTRPSSPEVSCPK